MVANRSLLDWGNQFLDYMQSIDHQFDPGHRIDHVLRVTKSAIELAVQESAELAIVLPAVILHDTKPVGKFDQDRARASTLSAAHSLQLLTDWGYPATFLPAIHHVILTHSFSAGFVAETLEAKLVQDADRLDAMALSALPAPWQLASSTAIHFTSTMSHFHATDRPMTPPIFSIIFT